MIRKPKYVRRELPASPRRKRTTPTSSRAWRALRRKKLLRQPECEYRYSCCRAVATEVDHADGDDSNNAWSNLRSACKPCHSRKTVERDGGFGRPVNREGTDE